MYDPTDPGNGLFLWVDETETVAQTDPPPGYSQAFAQLWHWAQAQGYQRNFAVLRLYCETFS